jgi:hypothetical protein
LRCQTNVGHSCAPVVGFLTFHVKSSGTRQVFGAETPSDQGFARGVPAFLLLFHLFWSLARLLLPPFRKCLRRGVPHG